MLTPDATLYEHAAVVGAAIPAPLMLPSMQQPGGGAIIECSMALASGFVEIASLAAGSSSRAVHVTATAASIGSQPAAASSQKATDAAARQPGLLPVLLAATASAGSSRAAATAGIQAATGRSGVWLDPAPFDCFLQLGQVFKAAGSTEVYVPAGMAALRVAAAAAELGSSSAAAAWAAAVPVPAAEGSVSSDFRLAGMSSPQQLCSISSLTAKSMGRAVSSSNAGAATSKAVEQIECLYEVAWQAADSSPLLAAAAAAGSSAKRLWRLSAAEQQ